MRTHKTKRRMAKRRKPTKRFPRIPLPPLMNDGIYYPVADGNLT